MESKKTVPMRLCAFARVARAADLSSGVLTHYTPIHLTQLALDLTHSLGIVSAHPSGHYSLKVLTEDP
jgi:hypothetical protein